MIRWRVDPDTLTRLRLLAQQDQHDAAIRDYLASTDVTEQRIALARVLGHAPDAVECQRMAAVRLAWEHEGDVERTVAAIARVAATCGTRTRYERSLDEAAMSSGWDGWWGHWAALSARFPWWY